MLPRHRLMRVIGRSGPHGTPVAVPQDAAVLRAAVPAERAAGLARPAADAAPCPPDDPVRGEHGQLPRHGRQAGCRGGAPARQHPQPGHGRVGRKRAAPGRRPGVLRVPVRPGAGRHARPRRRRPGAAGPPAAARIADHPGPRPGAGAHAARPVGHAHRHRPGRQRHRADDAAAAGPGARTAAGGRDADHRPATGHAGARRARTRRDGHRRGRRAGARRRRAARLADPGHARGRGAGAAPGVRARRHHRHRRDRLRAAAAAARAEGAADGHADRRQRLREERRHGGAADRAVRACSRVSSRTTRGSPT